ncbi:hypothetical protein UR09_05310 [Candidatus Nitromaritima sp. SCGC AAA799-A02]|nr:hypothetical protein UR09_05310 [Candidatus Nitromaritima sp. SCGC AAA799-A02]
MKNKLNQNTKKSKFKVEQQSKSTRKDSSINLPELSDEQREYVSKIIEWEKESYNPKVVIGGPYQPRVD